MMKRLLAVLVVLLSVGSTFAQGNAHMNSQKVLDTMPSRKKAMAELQEIQQTMYEEIAADEQQLQMEYKRFQDSSQYLSVTRRNYESRRLQKKQTELQSKAQEYDAEIQNMGQMLNAPILETIQKAVKIVCERENIEYVFEVETLMYAQGKDITDMVIVEVLKLEKAEAKVEAETPGK